MVSSLSDPILRKYFIDAQLSRYVSEGTKLDVSVENDLQRDKSVVFVNVMRKDGKSVLLSSDLTVDDKSWPRVSKELIAQLMMVG